MSRSLLATCGDVLRDPQAVIDACVADRRQLAEIVPRLLVIGVGCAAVFGAVVGSYRGGPQLGYAAVKMPLVLQVPLLVALPAVGALVEAEPRRLLVAGLVATTRTALLAAGVAPAVWLLYSAGIGYHLAVVVLAAALVAVGLPGLATVARAVEVEPGTRSRLVWIASVLILGAVTAQTGWVLRPFVARPTAEVALVRPIEGDVLGSLVRAPLAAAEWYVEYEPRESPWREE